MARRVAVVLLLAGVIGSGAPRAVYAQGGAAAGAPVRSARALPSTIPLFPLDDLMVFPNVIRPLRIYEPRYRAMMADALAGDRVIGIVQLRPGYEADYEGRPPVYAVGCAGVIADSEQLPDGTYNLLLRGLVKFRIVSEDNSRPYRRGRVEVLIEEPDATERQALAGERERLLGLLGASVSRPPDEVASEDIVNTLAQFLAMPVARRQELLEANGPLARARGLVRLIEDKVALPMPQPPPSSTGDAPPAAPPVTAP